VQGDDVPVGYHLLRKQHPTWRVSRSTHTELRKRESIPLRGDLLLVYCHKARPRTTFRDFPLLARAWGAGGGGVGGACRGKNGVIHVNMQVRSALAPQ
jgi:hypothetical protein